MKAENTQCHCNRLIIKLILFIEEGNQFVSINKRVSSNWNGNQSHDFDSLKQHGIELTPVLTVCKARQIRKNNGSD